MEIKGTIIQVLPIKTGSGKNGDWKSQDYIIETEGRYPKKICFNVWGDNIDKFALSYYDKITAHIEIESREFNEKWFTTVRAWKIEKVTEQSQQPIEEVTQPTTGTPLPVQPQQVSDESGLPF